MQRLNNANKALNIKWKGRKVDRKGKKKSSKYSEPTYLSMPCMVGDIFT